MFDCWQVAEECMDDVVFCFSIEIASETKWKWLIVSCYNVVFFYCYNCDKHIPLFPWYMVEENFATTFQIPLVNRKTVYELWTTEFYVSPHPAFVFVLGKFESEKLSIIFFFCVFIKVNDGTVVLRFLFKCGTRECTQGTAVDHQHKRKTGMMLLVGILSLFLWLFDMWKLFSCFGKKN